MIKVFISHSHKNKDSAKMVYDYLKNNSAQAWLDENEILVGDSIPDKIQKGLDSSDFIIILLSKYSVKSGWVKREIESKLINEISTGKISILPVLCENLDESWSIPPLLSSKKYADIISDFERGMRDVLNAIKGHAKIDLTRPKSKNVYLGYILGFTIAKISWHHGNKLEKMGLIFQFKEFCSKLSIDDVLTEEILNNFKPSSDLGDVLKNAHLGLNIRQTLSNILFAKYGEIVAAAYRFGFNLIYIMPQLEFVSMAKEMKSKKTPVEQLLGPMKNQFDNLVSDGEIILMEEKYLQNLKEAHDSISEKGADKVREFLIKIGGELEKRFKV